MRRNVALASNRLEWQDALTFCAMMNVSTDGLNWANQHGRWEHGPLTIQKVPLDGRFVFTFRGKPSKG